MALYMGGFVEDLVRTLSFISQIKQVKRILFLVVCGDNVVYFMNHPCLCDIYITPVSNNAMEFSQDFKLLL